MAGKKNNSEDMKKSDSEENIERLDDRFIDSAEDEIDIKLTADQKIDDRSIDQLFEDNDKPLDHSIDRLFEEDRKSFKGGLKDKVQKALSQPVMSKASLYRMRTKEPSEVDLSEREIMPTLEDQWIQDESNSATVSWVKWFILLGILLAMSAGIWAFINLSGEEADKGEKAQEIKEIALVSVQSDIDDAQNIANVSACVKKYLEATSIEERAKYCRNQESTLRKMTKSYANELIFDIYHFEGIAKSSEIRMEDKEITIVSANISSQSGGTGVENKPKSLLLEKQEDGTYLVDWETAVVYQPADWNAFIVKRSTEAHVFRLEVRERINYGPYLYEFSDDNIYQAYRISIRGNAEKYLIGYAKKGSEVDKIMKSLTLIKGNKNTGSRMTVPVMLKLVFPEGALSDQCVEITEVISDSWFIQ